MKLYMVGHRETVDDSHWRVAAESPKQAAELYVQAMLDQAISVDEGEFEDIGEIEVKEEYEVMPTEPGVIQWSDETIETFDLEEFEAWNKIYGSGMEP
ncbi:hypothetical protein OCH239_10825 [Roseivivax halodurans JCM 10272]|uniref:Uncharacterized protein n=1 Tax=Roseivivax halodurans JCM 10272 TaxID=1449350 RepID=X7EDX6_9RHOB|nr:hypothetical protein [Roseivivax halodurans]ETX13328.1 hypothetical protein OCH239_10825 [Roseivivax halodurans JCM 10272]